MSQEPSPEPYFPRHSSRRRRPHPVTEKRGDFTAEYHGELYEAPSDIKDLYIAFVDDCQRRVLALQNLGVPASEEHMDSRTEFENFLRWWNITGDDAKHLLKWQCESDRHLGGGDEMSR